MLNSKYLRLFGLIIVAAMICSVQATPLNPEAAKKEQQVQLSFSFSDEVKNVVVPKADADRALKQLTDMGFISTPSGLMVNPALVQMVETIPAGESVRILFNMPGGTQTVEVTKAEAEGILSHFAEPKA
jgi:hypothetical protein